MGVGTSTSLSQEFVDQLTAEMIVEPDPAYIFARLAGGARAGAMAIPDIMGRSGVSANMAEAMGAGLGTLDPANPRFMAVAKSFMKVVMEPGTLPGKVILVDQPRYLDAGLFTSASRQLTEATRITETPIAPTMGQASLTVAEYGGPHDGTAVSPLAVSDFAKRRSKHDLIEYLGLLLRRDRNKFLDAAIIEQLLTTTNQTIGTGGTTTASMSAGSNLLLDDDLATVKRKLMERNIPMFPTGMYGLVISPVHEQQLRQDSQFREIARYLAGSPGNILVAGHIADYGGFHIVVSNNIPTVGVGAGGAVTGTQALGFGPGGLAWAIGLDAEVRRSKDDDYGREDRLVWIAHENIKLLDASYIEKIVTS